MWSHYYLCATCTSYRDYYYRRPHQRALPHSEHMTCEPHKKPSAKPAQQMGRTSRDQKQNPLSSFKYQMINMLCL